MEKREPEVFYEDLPWTARFYLFPGRLFNSAEEKWEVSERQLEVWSIPLAAGLFLAVVWLSAFIRDSFPTLGALLVPLALWLNAGGVWWSLRTGKSRIQELRERRAREMLPHKVFPELMDWRDEDVIDIGDDKTWHYEGITRKGSLQLNGENSQEHLNVDLYEQDPEAIVNISLQSRQAKAERSENDKFYQKALSSHPEDSEEVRRASSGEDPEAPPPK